MLGSFSPLQHFKEYRKKKKKCKNGIKTAEHQREQQSYLMALHIYFL